MDDRHPLFIEEPYFMDEEEEKEWAVTIDGGVIVSVGTGAPREGNNSKRNSGESVIVKRGKPEKGGKRVLCASRERKRKEDKYRTLFWTKTPT